MVYVVTAFHEDGSSFVVDVFGKREFAKARVKHIMHSHDWGEAFPSPSPANILNITGCTIREMKIH